MEEEVLANYLESLDGQSVTINGYDGYKMKGNYYFIINAYNNEEIHYEQKAVSDFFIREGVKNIVTPIFSFDDTLLTQRNQNDYVVLQGFPSREANDHPYGQTLATFHQLGTHYPYEPRHISSYGKWRELWENKLSLFEDIYSKEYHERPVTPYQRLFIDTFPYIMGLTENALQYLQESEKDWRYHEGDRGTFAFQRYYSQSLEEMIWSPNLVYDHPARDIAEFIRPHLVNNSDHSYQQIRSFIQAYEQVSPLSVFSWRLIYARLLLPLHLFDYLEASWDRQSDESSYEEYKTMLKKQFSYEEGLKSIYDEIGLDTNTLNIPVLDW